MKIDLERINAELQEPRTKDLERIKGEWRILGCMVGILFIALSILWFVVSSIHWFWNHPLFRRPTFDFVQAHEGIAFQLD